jgi:uncharacterized protein (DUF488 family)
VVSSGKTRLTIYTVGHGTRTEQELLATLRSVEIGRLVDVRRHPGSRRYPHFSREALARSLGEAGIDYVWRGEELGGRRRSKGSSRHPAWRNASFQAYADYMDTPAFRAALRQLEAEAAEGPKLAFMCAETLFWRCHRRLIADALTVDGLSVVHLLSPTQRVSHPLHPDLRVDAAGLPVYDLHTTDALPL